MREERGQYERGERENNVTREQGREDKSNLIVQ